MRLWSNFNSACNTYDGKQCSYYHQDDTLFTHSSTGPFYSLRGNRPHLNISVHYSAKSPSTRKRKRPQKGEAVNSDHRCVYDPHVKSIPFLRLATFCMMLMGSWSIKKLPDGKVLIHIVFCSMAQTTEQNTERRSRSLRCDTTNGRTIWLFLSCPCSYCSLEHVVKMGQET